MGAYQFIYEKINDFCHQYSNIVSNMRIQGEDSDIFNMMGNSEQSAEELMCIKHTAEPNPSILPKHQDKGYDYQESRGSLYVDENDQIVPSDDASEKGINLNDVAQGALGDCYFIAAIGAIAMNRPEELKKLIRDNRDGTYDVTLYVKNGESGRTKKVITVDDKFPTKKDGTPVYANYGDKTEIYIMLLEKAYAIHKGGYAEIEGDNSGPAMELLTNKKSDYIYLDSYTADHKLIHDIYRNLLRDFPLVAATREFKNSTALEKMGIVSGHAYVIKSINRSSSTISLYNPWGGEYKHPEISIDEFKRYFSNYYILYK